MKSDSALWIAAIGGGGILGLISFWYTILRNRKKDREGREKEALSLERDNAKNRPRLEVFRGFDDHGNPQIVLSNEGLNPPTTL
jgi:hypothetical protein